MVKNIGNADRVIRIFVGAGILSLGLYFKSWWGAIGALPILTALIGWCPPYSLLGINTCKSIQKRA